MKAGGSVLLIVAGVLLLWLVVTGRVQRAAAAWSAIGASDKTVTPAALPRPATALPIPTMAFGTS